MMDCSAESMLGMIRSLTAPVLDCRVLQDQDRIMVTGWVYQSSFLDSSPEYPFSSDRHIRQMSSSPLLL